MFLVCPEGYYGDHCMQPCECPNENYVCHAVEGCVCRRNYGGENCEEEILSQIKGKKFSNLLF